MLGYLNKAAKDNGNVQIQNKTVSFDFTDEPIDGTLTAFIYEQLLETDEFSGGKIVE